MAENSKLVHMQLMSAPFSEIVKLIHNQKPKILCQVNRLLFQYLKFALLFESIA